MRAAAKQTVYPLRNFSWQTYQAPALEVHLHKALTAQSVTQAGLLQLGPIVAWANQAAASSSEHGMDGIPQGLWAVCEGVRVRLCE